MTEEAIPVQEINSPDKLQLKDVLDKLDNLQEGETLHISHSFNITRIGGLNIAIDVAMQGEKKPWGAVLPPGGDESLKSKKKRTENTVDIIESPNSEEGKSNAQIVGQALGSKIDMVLISHLDPDHLDFEAIRAMMESNEKLNVYGPLGWQSFIAKAHGFDKNSDDFNYLPENIKRRMKALSPKPANPNEKGLSDYYKGLNLSEVEFEDKGKKAKISSFEVPHIGGAYAEYSQGFILEAGDKKIVHIADAGFTPELLREVAEIQKKGHITQIYVSNAAYNPSRPYPPSPEATRVMEKVALAEQVSHSNYLPIALAAITDGETPIFLTHHGTYYDSMRVDIEKGGLSGRLPMSDKTDIPKKDWLGNLKSFILDALNASEKEISKAGPLANSTGSHGRTSKSELARSIAVHSKFTNKLVGWINKEKIPQEVGNTLRFPQANSIN